MVLEYTKKTSLDTEATPVNPDRENWEKKQSTASMSIKSGKEDRTAS